MQALVATIKVPAGWGRWGGGGTIWRVAGGKPRCSTQPHSRESAGGILGGGSWRRRGVGPTAGLQAPESGGLGGQSQAGTTDLA
jgi:hypothetical protein